ncbi:FtsW/RodA/SpoVE family cell cycle protein [Persicitalea sp.]|uniref:FtsW/RodA/SpoVE family cell cycle protein n=1 Tax=Persicitalea sp. TaxID=3100273 RepID=UPI003593176E
MSALHKIREVTQAWFQRNMKGDPWLWGIALFLLGIGVVVVYSASAKQAYSTVTGDTEVILFKQIKLAIASFVIMYLVHLIPYTKFVFFSRMGVWLAVILLLFTFFKGETINEADRWVEIPIINQKFQPSEIAKITLIAHLALILALRFKKDWGDKRLLVEPMLMIGLVCALIYRSNISTAALLGATCFMMLYVGKVPKRYLTITMVTFLIASGLLVVLKIGQRGTTAQSRFDTYFNPDTIAAQSANAYKAMARGGILGEGVANSQEKHFLPNGDSDFIFAIIVEEYGTVGALVVIVAFLLLLYRGLKAISKPKRPYGGLLSAGLTFSIVFQAFATMAVTVGLFPTTGQTLPFISNGGTSMLLTGAAMGIILSVSRGELEEKDI